LIDQQVWTIKDLEGMKTVYREVVAAVAKAKFKDHAGSRQKAKAAFERDLAKACAGIMRMHGVKLGEILTIETIGLANHWDVGDAVQDAKRAASGKDTQNCASGLLAVGRNLEKSEKPALALKSYRELVAKYPDSAEAKTALERIKALSK
jgi:hypothetical protein